MKKHDINLGMGTSITRRDYIGGVGVALSGSLATFAWAKTEAQRLIRALGIAPEPYADFSDRDLYHSPGLGIDALSV